MYYIVRFTFLARLALLVVSLMMSQSYYVNIFVTITRHLNDSAFYGILFIKAKALSKGKNIFLGMLIMANMTMAMVVDLETGDNKSVSSGLCLEFSFTYLFDADTSRRQLLQVGILNQLPNMRNGTLTSVIRRQEILFLSSLIVTAGGVYISGIGLTLGVGDVDDAFAAFTVVVSHDLVSVQYNILKSYFKGSDHSRYNECLPMKAVNPGFILELRKFNDISRSESELVENSRSRPFSLNDAVFELGADLQVEEHGNTRGNAYMEVEEC
ncbi:hypothetical protein M422DRAFT_49122 [Sphaerobolus stellatus SS14]|uniref:Uncharacterized protein n=1 Tax=Sphaerobolus stellatus (strain SS14) TaxID=990650 RepID=A0A0C9VGP9_SPHS4|nr:hypothetical protein M422DRAFT_49122 [Sphaerobolus stellatus SS14]